MAFGRSKLHVPDPTEALSGRDHRPFDVPATHYVLGTPLEGEPPAGHLELLLGMGCFWGAERIFWTLDGVFTTAVGYAGGSTPNPTYEEVCSGRTGHTEAVRVVFDPAVLSLDALLRAFWEGHDPTQGMRQGNDIGTQYRSAVYTLSRDGDVPTATDMLTAVEASRERYQQALDAAGLGQITTEIAPTAQLYYAEDYHQQYLAKNPLGYCGIGGTGVSCPVGITPA
jgi:peptide-methionine (S)-S-oxide reductase